MAESWLLTRAAMKEFMQLLSCNKCKQRPTEPIKYTSCNHVFCYDCVYNDSNCFVCGIPVAPQDKRHDDLTSNLVSACDSIIDVLLLSDCRESDNQSETEKQSVDKGIESKEHGKVEECKKIRGNRQVDNLEDIEQHEESEMDKELKEFKKEDVLSSTRCSAMLSYEPHKKIQTLILEKLKTVEGSEEPEKLKEFEKKKLVSSKSSATSISK